MMLTQLAPVKTRLGLTELDVAHDETLTRVIRAVSAWFDWETNRTLARTVNHAHEFVADEKEIRVPCYPVESVVRFELKSNEIVGWEVQPGLKCLLRRKCIVVLEEPIGNYLEQARVIYTGGYVLPGTVPEPGQCPLPPDLEHAAVEQVTWWFQNRERIGLLRLWEYHGTYRQFGGFDLLPEVKAILKKYTRW